MSLQHHRHDIAQSTAGLHWFNSSVNRSCFNCCTTGTMVRELISWFTKWNCLVWQTNSMLVIRQKLSSHFDYFKICMGLSMKPCTRNVGLICKKRKRAAKLLGTENILICIYMYINCIIVFLKQVNVWRCNILKGINISKGDGYQRHALEPLSFGCWETRHFNIFSDGWGPWPTQKWRKLEESSPSTEMLPGSCTTWIELVFLFVCLFFLAAPDDM